MSINGKVPLSSKRWTQLRSTDGHASHVPALLTKLDREWDQKRQPTWPPSPDDPWLSLFLAVRNQDRVEEVAYAVIPHLVDLVQRRSISQKAEVVDLALRLAFDPNREEIPADLIGGYGAAIAALGEMAEKVVAAGNMPSIVGAGIAMTLLAGGHRKAAALAWHIADESLLLNCCRCDTLFVLQFDYDQWWMRPMAGGAGISLRRPGNLCKNETIALILAHGDRLPDGMRRAADLEAEVPCPKCASVIDIYRQLDVRLSLAA
jgi:hypothetical protein